MTAETGGEKAAILQLQTQPADAQVLLDGRILGSTPLVNRECPPGLHLLTINVDGFAPRTLRVPLTANRTVNLGTIPMARQDTLITIWRVGCPHDGDTPPARIPGDLEALIAASGFRVRTRSFPAATFPGEFIKAREKDGGAGLPDVVAGSNYGPFEEFTRWGSAAEPGRLVRMSGVLTMIGGFAFLVTRSPGHAAARQIATTNEGMSERFSWSLDERWLQDLTGQIRSQDDRCLLVDLNCQAVSAYLGGRMGEITSLLHRDMLGRQGYLANEAFAGTAWGNRAVPEDIRTLYTLGNGKLAFVLAAASLWNERLLEGGCWEVLSVWVKAEGRWSLLAITQDPVSIEATREDIPRLAGSLTEGIGEAPWPAGVQVPITAAPYPTENGQEFGSFRWTPDTSEDVVAEVAEFHLDSGSRLFLNPGGEVSEGDLWGGSPRSWRVWLVGKDGQIVTSESLEERERKDCEGRFHRACEVLQRLGVRTVAVEYDQTDDDVFSIDQVHYQPGPAAGVPEGLEVWIKEHVSGQLLNPGWGINVGSRGTLGIDVGTRQPVRPTEPARSQDEVGFRTAASGTPSELAAMILGCRGPREDLWVLADWLEETLGLPRLAALLRSPELKPLPKSEPRYQEFDYFPLGGDAFCWLARGSFLEVPDPSSATSSEAAVVGLYAHPAGHTAGWVKIVNVVGLEDGLPDYQVTKHPLVEEVMRELAASGKQLGPRTAAR